MKKILLLILAVFTFSTYSQANEINKYIKQSDFGLKSTVSIYAKNDKKVIYKTHSEKLLNPASILKTLTFGAGYLVLGENYNFETALYKDSSNNYYIKLSGDTLLTSKDLVNLFSKIKKCKINNIYIDDSIIEKTMYPAGWMQEDMFPTERAITPYIVDNNMTQIALKRSSLATTIDIIQNDSYKIPIIKLITPPTIEVYKILSIESLIYS